MNVSLQSNFSGIIISSSSRDLQGGMFGVSDKAFEKSDFASSKVQLVKKEFAPY
jgi:hypothetical protein